MGLRKILGVESIRWSLSRVLPCLIVWGLGQFTCMANPFLNNTLRPNWQDLKVERIEDAINEALEVSQKNIDAIAQLAEGSHTYENTLKAFDDASETLENSWGKVAHLDSVCNTKEFREVYNKLMPRVSEFGTKVYLNEKLWESINSFSKSEEAQILSATKKRHLNEVIEDFKQSGANLGDKDKSKLEKLNAKLAQLTQKFTENVLDSTNAWELIIDDEAQLAGLPQSAKTLANEDAKAKGHENAWRFTLHAPSRMPVLQYLDSDEIRKKFWEAGNEIGSKEPFDNAALIDEILQLRQEKAQLLGKKNFADHVLKRRMAKSGQAALDFLHELRDKSEKFFIKEVASLEEYKSNATGTAAKLEPWDVHYWAQIQRQELYDFDEEALRPYFNVESVIAGMFEITQKLFNIEIKEIPGVSVWHEDVKYYEIHDASGQMLGAFYSDWYPRESKRAGAWMNSLLTKDQGEPALGLICGNMTKPTADAPALLTHLEVETIFHEFGHLLHHLLGDSEVKSLKGIHVVWDFVELPSQIMENWCWERESLDLFARHYQTDESIPEGLFNKMIRARNYNSGIAMMRQLSLSKMDLELHINYQGNEQKLDDFIDEVLDGYLIKFNTKNPNISRMFTHLFGDSTGYAAGYYSYKWAEVLDADAFTRFKKEGLLNPKTGMEFREKILSQGNNRDADQLFRDFMGREPKVDSLLERSGLIEKVVEPQVCEQ